MFQYLKKVLYFPLAYYFRIFAHIKLWRWNPRVIVVTGSSGKTTLLHLIESQIGDKAKYSHHANSSYGIPFDILGLNRKTLLLSEWFELFLKTPFLAFSAPPQQKIYIVEADCDRPYEGHFLATLLQPDVTIWLSSTRTHSMNFDHLVKEGFFKTVDEAIAFEYGFFAQNTQKLVIYNEDSNLIENNIKRTKARSVGISKKSLKGYEVDKEGTLFETQESVYKLKNLLPEAVFYSISATRELLNYLDLPFDPKFTHFEIPPGRSSIFKGIRNITIVDSCYNSNYGSASEIINMFNKIKTSNKWVVIGDMLEQGSSEQEEHQKLANLVVKSDYNKVILLGPRIIKHGLEIIKNHYKDRVVAFTSPSEVLDYLNNNIKGGEAILFKGARFLEGVIENLLKDKSDAKKLARREKIWEIRRKKWGL